MEEKFINLKNLLLCKTKQKRYKQKKMEKVFSLYEKDDR